MGKYLACGRCFLFSQIRMKKPISELNAVAAIIDSVFQQVDDHWGKIWSPVENGLQNANIGTPDSQFVKFNFSLAVLAINFRATFDLFPRAQSERLFSQLQQLLHKQLGGGDGFAAVQSAIGKYIEAYNAGILQIRNPVQDVATLLYYKIGLKNTEQHVVDETFFAPDPNVVGYLASSLMLFTGKWETLLQRFELPGGGRRSP